MNLQHLIVCVVFIVEIESRKHRTRRVHKSTRECKEPYNLRELLTSWMQESLEGFDLDVIESDPTASSDNDAFSKRPEPKICRISLFRSPRTQGDSSVMQRALCPWESKIDYDERREPKLLNVVECLCRRSRGATGAFCLPISRHIPVLRKRGCNSSGFWNYERSIQTVTVGCHSVLPRTQRATMSSTINLKDHQI